MHIVMLNIKDIKIGNIVVFECGKIKHTGLVVSNVSRQNYSYTFLIFDPELKRMSTWLITPKNIIFETILC